MSLWRSSAIGLLLLPSLLGLAGETGYIEMPKSDDGTWVLTSPHGSGRAWGRPETVRHLILVAREWRRRYPQGPRLRIGDISRPDGSTFPPHKTHTDGCSIDVFTSPENICHIDYKNQDLTAEFARLFIDLGAKQILYNGPEVIRTRPGIIQAWPLHDDHFHVVVDPAKVPKEGAAIVVAAADILPGGWLGGDAYQDGRFALAWRAIPEDPRLAAAWVQVRGADQAILADSGPRAFKRPRWEAEAKLESGRRYAWRVQLAAKADGPWELDSGWLEFGADFAAPELETTEPADGAVVDWGASLTFTYRDAAGGEQAWFEIDLSTHPEQKKFKTLERVSGAERNFPLELKLEPDKVHHWRVRASDGRGNVGLGPWRSFRTANDFKPKPRRGRVKESELNLRAGPGTEHKILGKLKGGQEVLILETSGAWLRVRAARAGQVVEGWAHGDYIERSAGK